MFDGLLLAIAVQPMLIWLKIFAKKHNLSYK